MREEGRIVKQPGAHESDCVVRDVLGYEVPVDKNQKPGHKTKPILCHDPLMQSRYHRFLHSLLAADVIERLPLRLISAAESHQ
jgi:hypothetical protein